MTNNKNISQQNFEQLRQSYRDAFAEHGESSAGLLLPKGRHELRFSALDELLEKPDLTILDYGCGFAYLKDYISNRGFKAQYSGVDLSAEFIDICRTKHPDTRFEVISPDGQLDSSYDVIFLSGVFNIATNPDSILSKKYAFDLMEQLYSKCKIAMVCDFLTDRVDFRAENAQHFGPEELSTFCFDKLSRRFLIRHDILPFEVSFIAYKQQQILSPQNIYPSA